MHGRVFAFNVSVAQVWAEQEYELEKAGQRMPVEDSYIAAQRDGTSPYETDFSRPGVM